MQPWGWQELLSSAWPLGIKQHWLRQVQAVIMRTIYKCRDTSLRTPAGSAFNGKQAAAYAAGCTKHPRCLSASRHGNTLLGCEVSSTQSRQMLTSWEASMTEPVAKIQQRMQ